MRHTLRQSVAVALACLPFACLADFDGFPIAANYTWQQARSVHAISQLVEAVQERCDVLADRGVGPLAIVETWTIQSGYTNAVFAGYTNRLPCYTNLVTTNCVGDFVWTDEGGTNHTISVPLTQSFVTNLDAKMFEITPYFINTNLTTDGTFDSWFNTPAYESKAYNIYFDELDGYDGEEPPLPNRTGFYQTTDGGFVFGRVVGYSESDPETGEYYYDVDGQRYVQASFEETYYKYDYPYLCPASVMSNAAIGHVRDAVTDLYGTITNGAAYFTRQPQTTNAWVLWQAARVPAVALEGVPPFDGNYYEVSPRDVYGVDGLPVAAANRIFISEDMQKKLVQTPYAFYLSTVPTSENQENLFHAYTQLVWEVRYIDPTLEISPPTKGYFCLELSPPATNYLVSGSATMKYFDLSVNAPLYSTNGWRQRGVTSGTPPATWESRLYFPGYSLTGQGQKTDVETNSRSYITNAWHARSLAPFDRRYYDDAPRPDYRVVVGGTSSAPISITISNNGQAFVDFNDPDYAGQQVVRNVNEKTEITASNTASAYRWYRVTDYAKTIPVAERFATVRGDMPLGTSVTLMWTNYHSFGEMPYNLQARDIDERCAYLRQLIWTTTEAAAWSNSQAQGITKSVTNLTASYSFMDPDYWTEHGNDYTSNPTDWTNEFTSRVRQDYYSPLWGVGPWVGFFDPWGGMAGYLPVVTWDDATLSEYVPYESSIPILYAGLTRSITDRQLVAFVHGSELDIPASENNNEWLTTIINNETVTYRMTNAWRYLPGDPGHEAGLLWDPFNHTEDADAGEDYSFIACERSDSISGDPPTVSFDRQEYADDNPYRVKSTLGVTNLTASVPCTLDAYCVPFAKMMLMRSDIWTPDGDGFTFIGGAVRTSSVHVSASSAPTNVALTTVEPAISLLNMMSRHDTKHRTPDYTSPQLELLGGGPEFDWTTRAFSLGYIGGWVIDDMSNRTLSTNYFERGISVDAQDIRTTNDLVRIIYTPPDIPGDPYVYVETLTNSPPCTFTGKVWRPSASAYMDGVVTPATNSFWFRGSYTNTWYSNLFISVGSAPAKAGIWKSVWIDGDWYYRPLPFASDPITPPANEELQQIRGAIVTNIIEASVTATVEVYRAQNMWKVLVVDSPMVEMPGTPSASGNNSDAYRAFDYPGADWRNTGWINDTTNLPCWLAFDFGEATNISHLFYVNGAESEENSKAKNVDVQYSSDNSSWTTATNLDMQASGDVHFTPQTMRYWRLYINSLYTAERCCIIRELNFNSLSNVVYYGGPNDGDSNLYPIYPFLTNVYTRTYTVTNSYAVVENWDPPKTNEVQFAHRNIGDWSGLITEGNSEGGDDWRGLGIAVTPLKVLQKWEFRRK